jgi:hypothetical protein
MIDTKYQRSRMPMATEQVKDNPGSTHGSWVLGKGLSD